MNADRIVAIEHGEIVEQGSHSELLKLDGRYADLWSKQVFLMNEDDQKAPEVIEGGHVRAGGLCSESTVTEMDQSQEEGPASNATAPQSNGNWSGCAVQSPTEVYFPNKSHSNTIMGILTDIVALQAEPCCTRVHAKSRLLL